VVVVVMVVVVMVVAAADGVVRPKLMWALIETTQIIVC
jgi:hypothetical protein